MKDSEVSVNSDRNTHIYILNLNTFTCVEVLSIFKDGKITSGPLSFYIIPKSVLPVMKKYAEQSFSCLHHVIVLFSKQHADPAAEMNELSLFEAVLPQEAPQTLQVCMNVCCSLHFCVKKIIIRLSQSRKDIKAFKIIGKLSG